MTQLMILNIEKDKRVVIRHEWISKMEDFIIHGLKENIKKTKITFFKKYNEKPIVVNHTIDDILKCMQNGE